MNIKRGEIWLVNLNPTIGAEIRKTRLVVIVSSDAIGALPIRLVAPVTDLRYQLRPRFARRAAIFTLTNPASSHILFLLPACIHNTALRNYPFLCETN